MHSTAGGAKPKLGVGGRVEMMWGVGGGGEHKVVCVLSRGNMGRRACRTAGERPKWQNNVCGALHSQTALPRSSADLKSQLNCSYKRPHHSNVCVMHSMRTLSKKTRPYAACFRNKTPELVSVQSPVPSLGQVCMCACRHSETMHHLWIFET